jgi:arylsulfatase A-like enzyme
MVTILYLLDSLRLDHVGLFNREAAEITPNIDSLEKDSVKCLKHVAPASWTLPSLASILTGYHPAQINVNFNTDIIPAEIKRLPQYYKEKGYLTFAVSANPYFSQNFNAQEGFDDFRLLLDFKTFKKGDISGIPTSSDINRNIFEIIEKNPGKNIFIMVWSLDTHNPYFLRDKKITQFVDPQDWEEIYSLERIEKSKDEDDFRKIKNIYRNMVYYNDSQIGEMIRFLKSRKLFDSSTIAILGDHGETLEKEGFGHNGPLSKEQIRVPLIFKLPKEKKHSFPLEIKHLTGMDNLLATLLKIDFNLDLPGSRTVFEKYRDYIYSTRGYAKDTYFYESILAEKFLAINTRPKKFSLIRDFKNLAKRILGRPVEKIVRKMVYDAEDRKAEFSLTREEAEKLLLPVRSGFHKISSAQRIKKQDQEKVKKALKELGYN